MCRQIAENFPELRKITFSEGKNTESYEEKVKHLHLEYSKDTEHQKQTATKNKQKDITYSQLTDYRLWIPEDN